MPAVANENSGLATASGKPTFWTHNDSGGKPELYEVDSVGNLLYTWALPDLQNKDWEELSRDPQGNIYIGDTGNNTNTRKDLCIYKVSDSHSSTKAEKSHTITLTKRIFRRRSPKKLLTAKLFLCQRQLVPLSKNWGKPTAKLYTLPARAGDYTAVLKDSIRLNGMITAADISPDQQTFAVLTYGKVFFFAIEEKKIDFKHPLSCLKIGRGQVEALVFVTNHDLLVTNEKGKIYKITRR
ncbi:hypothetical protein BWI96_10825 [Siphonobacter sp. SORGH_AS_0500]|nr:hypothetical protein BWI96_10825 [Siphonobacter sp. SORGH_AS_0500]